VKRVYDPEEVPTTPTPTPTPIGRHWTKQDVVMNFGGHTTWGNTNDQTEIDSGYERNKIDRTTATGARNTYEAIPFTDLEKELWDVGYIKNNSSPLGNVSPQREAALRAMIAKRTEHQKMAEARAQAIKNSQAIKAAQANTNTTGGSVVTRQSGGKLINGKALKSKPVILAKGSKMHSHKGGCGCGGADKLQIGGQMESAKQSVMGTTKRLIDTRRANNSADSNKSGYRSFPAPKLTDSVNKPKAPRSPGMYARGGGIPDIDEESPIRYRR
jgi:hypothetical protein